MAKFIKFALDSLSSYFNMFMKIGVYFISVPICLDVYGEELYGVFLFSFGLANSFMFFDFGISNLNIPKERCFDSATRLGEPAESGSFTSKVKKGEIDRKVISKREQYLKITSWNERIIHSYFLRRNFIKNDFKKIFISIIYLIPLKHGSIKNYFCQISTINILWSMSNLLIENFQNDFLNDKVHLSGEI